MVYQRGTMTTNSNLISSQLRRIDGNCFNCGNTRRNLRRVNGEGLLCGPCINGLIRESI